VSSLGEWEAKPVEVNHKNCVKACCVDGCHEILRFPKEVFVSPNLLPIPAIYACSTTKLRQKVKINIVLSPLDTLKCLPLSTNPKTD